MEENNMKNREIRKAIKTHGRAKAKELGIPVDSLTKKPVGRPKKHHQTQSKTFRLPIHIIEQIEKDRCPGESFTDVLIRLVKLGLLI